VPPTPPGGPVGPPGGPRHLARDADRERLVGILREHYALGVLDLDELNRRVEIVLAARYAEDAAGAVADLPPIAGPAAGGPGPGASGPGGPGRVKRPRKHGHAHAASPGAGWLPTDERFRDPTTRVIMRVWIDPSTQPETRWYVPEADD
jgi:Domain of unknown function (DUF1707)